ATRPRSRRESAREAATTWAGRRDAGMSRKGAKTFRRRRRPARSAPRPRVRSRVRRSLDGTFLGRRRVQRDGKAAQHDVLLGQEVANRLVPGGDVLQIGRNGLQLSCDGRREVVGDTRDLKG